MKTLLHTVGLLAAVLVSAPVLAQEYRVRDAWESQMLSIEQDQVRLDSVNASGNLCHLQGRLQGQGSRRFYADDEGCRVDFTLHSGGVKVSIAAAHHEACRQYCGHNAWMEGDYERVPAACARHGEAQMEQRFQAAYRARRFNEAVQIKNGWLQQCETFAHVLTQMRARNDIAIAYKNAGNKAACRRVLQPLRAEIEGKSDFEPNDIIADNYRRELKAARFNWQACR